MGDTNGIGIGNHPAKKSEIGRRAAFMMTNLTYGNMAINVASTGPTMYSPYYDVANDKNHLYLEFVKIVRQLLIKKVEYNIQYF